MCKLYDRKKKKKKEKSGDTSSFLDLLRKREKLDFNVLIESLLSKTIH